MTQNERMDALTDRIAELTTSCALIANGLKTSNETTGKLDDRVRVIEDWKNRLMPVVWATTLIVGAVVMSVADNFFNG